MFTGEWSVWLGASPIILCIAGSDVKATMALTNMLTGTPSKTSMLSILPQVRRAFKTPPGTGQVLNTVYKNTV
jgi:hypothetical protein